MQRADHRYSRLLCVSAHPSYGGFSTEAEQREFLTSRRRLVALLDGTAPVVEDDGHRLPLHIETVPDRRGRNLKLVLRSGEEQKLNVDLELIALIRKAEVARQQLFTQASVTSDRTAERVARLAFLAPDIITAILEGRQPATLTSRRLMKHAAIPLDWKAQREALGFQ